jgi:transcriptional regulator GlxA family with amidase domain
MILHLLAASLLALETLTAVASAEKPVAPEPPSTRNVAIVVYEGIEILDFAGPSEVFAAASGFGESRGSNAFRVYTVGATKQPVVSQGFVKITPEFSIEDAPKPDIVVVPGGSSGAVTNDPKFMAWFKAAAARADVTLSVCTGAFVIAKAGLLDGKEATTWYGAIAQLREAVPTAHVEDGRRFVDIGSVVTTAGVSAGIDGSLHVVARLLGRQVADRTARYMEYHWTPEPYLASRYSQLNPSLDANGRAMQQAGILEEEGRPREAAAAYRSMLAANPGDAYAWYRLGAALQRSGDLAGAVSAARRASQFASVRSGAFYNLACAYALQGKKDDALVAIEQAIHAGYKGKGRLETDSDLASIREDERFKKLVGSL